MFVKNKTVRTILCAALSLILLYTGITCGATFYKAATLPHIVSKTETHTFLGYYIISAVYGAICLAALALLILIIVKSKKNKK